MRFRVLQSCPAHLKAKYRVALTTALEAVHEAAQRRDPVKEVRAWKLFSLLPFWLLRRPVGEQWESLHRAATRDTTRNKELRAPSEATTEQRARAACQKVRLGEVSRARQCLTGACVAVGSEETLRELQNNRSQIQLRELPPEVLDWEPESPVELDRITFINSLRSSPRTSETLTG